MALWKRILVEGDVVGDGIIAVTDSAPHTVRLGDPAGLDELTSPVNGTAAAADKMLIWDESASIWKWIDTDNFPQVHLGNTNLTQTSTSRTYDVLSAGTLTFINNRAAKVKFQNEDAAEVNDSNVIIGSQVEAFRDDGGFFGGIKIEGSSQYGSGDNYGLWIESGHHYGSSIPASAVIHLERSYDIDNYTPNDGDYIGRVDFSAPYQSSTGWTYYESGFSGIEGGEGVRYVGIQGRIDSKGGTGLTDKPLGALEVYVIDDWENSSGVVSTQFSTMLRVDGRGVRVNNPDDLDNPDGTGATAKDYYLAPNRGQSGQILHSNGNGNTYWGDNIPSAAYNSDYAFVNDDLQTELAYVAAPTFYAYYKLNLPDLADSGVIYNEGVGVTITSTALGDRVTFSNLSSIMSNFTVTISGALEFTSGSNGQAYITSRGVCTAEDSSTSSVFGSSYYLYQQPLGGATYSATNGGAFPSTSSSIPFSYTTPLIGDINGSTIESIYFEFYARRFPFNNSSGQHSFRLRDLNITIA